MRKVANIDRLGMILSDLDFGAQATVAKRELAFVDAKPLPSPEKAAAVRRT